MIHEEILLRRNLSRRNKGDDPIDDDFIQKVEISEPEFSKRVSDFYLDYFPLYSLKISFFKKIIGTTIGNISSEKSL